MAAKNPKRVAAGKKAWANRSTASKKRSFTRKGGRRRKPIQRGIPGRVGAMMVGALPTGIAGFDAAEKAMSAHSEAGFDYNALSAVKLGVLRFCNNMGVGYFGVQPFEGAEFTKKNGYIHKNPNVGAGVPKGSLLVVTGVGLGLMFEDWVASKLAGGRPVKIIGTNYNAIGGS